MSLGIKIKRVFSLAVIIGFSIGVIGCGGGSVDPKEDINAKMLDINKTTENNATSIYATSIDVIIKFIENKSLFNMNLEGSEERLNRVLMNQECSLDGNILITSDEDAKTITYLATKCKNDKTYVDGKAVVYVKSDKTTVEKIEYFDFKYIGKDKIELFFKDSIMRITNANRTIDLEHNGYLIKDSKKMEFKDLKSKFALTLDNIETGHGNIEVYSTLIDIAGYIKYSKLEKWIKVDTIKSLKIKVNSFGNKIDLVGCPMEGTIKIEGKNSSNLELDFNDAPNIVVKLNSVDISPSPYTTCDDIINLYGNN